MADVSAILSKLYSGSPLSAEEKAAIGIGPAVAPAPNVDLTTAKTVATGGKSTDPNNRLPGETAAQANARITQAYKDLLAKPVLSQEAADAGAQVRFVRTGPGGQGEYTVVTPAGYVGPDIKTTEWTAGIIPSTGKYTTGSTLGVWSNGDGTYTKVDNLDPTKLQTAGTTNTTTPTPNPSGKKINITINPSGSTGSTGGTGGTTGTTGSTTGTAGTPAQSAKDYISKFLNDAGLGNLAGKVWEQWTSGQSEDQIVDWIRSTPEYATRFPAMATLRKDGRSISEAQYVAKEQADIDLMKQYGIPDPIATDKKLLGNLIANNVSQVTLQKRLIAGQDTVLGFDNQIRQYAKDTYGLGDGALLAWVLNPDIALPVLEQQAQAIRIGGAALTSGYDRGLGAQGELGKTQAEALAAQGISQQQAQQGFTQLAQMGQLEQQLPGDVSGQLTSQEMIDAIFGVSGAAQQKLGKVKQTRVGEFQQGGNFAAAQSGIVGIGQAPQV